MSRFPWQAVMAAGMGALRYSSESFWRMTLRELSAALDIGSLRPAPPDRTTLEELMHRFPDKGKDGNGD